MAKYTYKIKFNDGEVLDAVDFDDDELYDTYEEAEDAGLQTLSDNKLGMDIFNMSNPGDYPETGDDYDGDVIVVKVK